jgi:uncharacterized protein YjdB
MKRVGRWTWMLLTLLLLLCTTAFAKTIECGSIELEQPIEMTFEEDGIFRYTLTAPIDGMRVQVEWLTESKDFTSLKIAGRTAYGTNGIYNLGERGEKNVDLSTSSSAKFPMTVRFVLHEYRNDEQEPNDVIPTELHDGDIVKFALDYSDWDSFVITTDKPGQDISLTFGGFNYADRTVFRLHWNGSYDIQKNGTIFLHTAQPGAYHFALDMTAAKDISRSMEIRLLDGDENELNDTKETATPLPIGTDAAFSIGGIGDADWFSFEAVPEEGQSKFYTLRLLNVEPGKTEGITYEVYAPDGTVVASKVIYPRHSRILPCRQQGQYTIKLSAIGSNIQRAPLRIRVEEGDDDPYESNDTWLDAAYIEPGQLISHVLPSGDADWFCFTVPENHMTLHVSSDCKGIQAMVYIGQTLAEYGDKARVIWSENTSRGKSAENLYWKLGEKGLYYIKLIGGSSEAIRSTTISLIPPEAIEDNDTWYRATPLYEEFTQAFDVSGPNDMDWFRFTVPEGSQKTLLLDIAKRDTGNKYERVSFYLYREAYFDNQDDGSLKEGAIETGPDPESRLYYWDIEPGTYYLLAKSNNSSNYFTRVQKLNICYKLVSHLNNNTIATASPLKEREWQDVWQKGYFSIGEHKAGEVVQIQRDEGGERLGGYTSIYDADGKCVTDINCGNFSFRIPADGGYYLYVPASIKISENEPMRTTRIRYYTHSDEIGVVPSVSMQPNDSGFLDLWFSPEMRSQIQIECENKNVIYDWSTGYLTVAEDSYGSVDIYFTNGCAEDDDNWLEAYTSVIWLEIPVTYFGISAPSQTLSVGSSSQIKVVTDEDYVGHIMWESSDTSVLRVLSNGKVVAVGQGEAVITASIGEATSSVTITVTGEQPGESGLTGVSLDRYTLTLYAGEEAEQLTATLKPEGTEAAIHWTSSNQTAATVSQDGKVTPLAAGVTVVTAAAGDYRASCIVTVQPKRVRVTGIRFDEPTHTLMMGSTVTLQPIIAPDDATVKNLTWVSSDEQIATVSRTGIVTALSVGETTITATTVDGGYSAEIKIIVTAAAQLGDVNGDGYIDAADALLCLRASVGLITLTPEQEAAADVNHDGLIDAGDAILILRYDARLIPSLN